MTDIGTIVNFMESKCLPILYTPMNRDIQLANERKVARLEGKNEEGKEEKNNNRIRRNALLEMMDNNMLGMIDNILNIMPIQNQELVDVPTPLSETDRKILVEIKYSDITQDDVKGEINKMCSICYRDYEPSDIINILPCDGNHIYHKECIGMWLNTKKTCPICRENIEDTIHNS